MKFRFHRGGFAESMATQVEIKTWRQLEALVEEQLLYEPGQLHESLKIEHNNTPDPRNGWKATHIVLLEGRPVGYIEDIPS
jgi:hypothetical protein